MKSEAEKYLREINRGLSGIPKQEKADITSEIQSHIYEAAQDGEDISQILTRLGSAEKLAKAYSLGYCVEHKVLRPKDILSNLDFYLLTGISGVFIILLLSFLAAVFVAVAVVIPGTAITNLLGVTHIPMFVWEEASIAPGILQIALGLAVSAVFAWLTYTCWGGIKHCVKAIAADYRKLKISSR